MLNRESILRAIPGLAVLCNYDRSQWKRDAVAAAVVAVVLIPSAFAYAELAKCAPAAGLYASVTGMIVFGLLTSSRHVIVGPDAAIAILVGTAIGPLAADDPGKAVTLATVLAFLTGGVLLLMSRLRLGLAADFLSSPALLGFMNGAAIVIIASQIGKLCGITLTADNTLLRFWEWLTKIGSTHSPTLTVGLVCCVILALARWKLKKMPGAVLVFALALLAGRCFDFSGEGMQVIGSVDLTIPDGIRPRLDLTEAGTLFTAAIGIALLVFSEGVVLGRSIAGKHGYAIDPDRELLALGAANLAAGMLCSFSVGSSQTRSLLNDATGGRTQMVSFLAAAIVCALVFLFAPWLATIPSVAIAAILIFTGVSLVDIGVYARLWQMNHFSAVVAAVTTLGVVTLGVLQGILLGVVISLLGVLTEIVRPQDALLGHVEGSTTMHDIGDDDEAKTIPGLVVYRFYGPVIFANVRFLIERLEMFISRETQQVKQVILDARAIPSIDLTALEQLTEYVGALKARGIEFVVAKAHFPLRSDLAASGNVLADSCRFSQLADAIAAYENSSDSSKRG